jgi:hypothetical protein
LHLHFTKALMVRHEFALAGHQELLLLFPSLEIVLLLGRQGPAKTGEGTLQWGDGAPSITGRERTAGLGWGPVWDADLWDKEGLSGVSDAPDDLAKRLELAVFNLPDAKVG